MSLLGKLLGSNMLIQLTPYEDGTRLLVMRRQDRHSFLAFSRKLVGTFEMSACNGYWVRPLLRRFVFGLEQYDKSLTLFTSSLFVSHFGLLLSPPMQCGSYFATPNIFPQHILLRNLAQETFDEVGCFLRAFVD